MSLHYEPTRVLIWGKTHPQLSYGHKEVVCTGGCTTDGKPIRIYPVPLRYLPDKQQYRLYDWIEVPLARSHRDRRPESRKAIPDRIRRLDHVDTGKERDWAARREVVFADPGWRYDCVRDLEAAEREHKTSLGFVKVGEVGRVWLEERSEEERAKHETKLGELQQATDMFGADQKDLDFFPWKVMIRWRCSRLGGPDACPGHTNTVLDWGIGELARRDGADVALQKMTDVTDLGSYDLWFFMGNFLGHPTKFGIVGVWYPLKRATAQQDLFVS